MTDARTVHVSRDHWSRDFDPDLSPAAVALPGDEIIVQTFCCAKGSVTRSISTSAETFYEDLGYTPGMPVTGPIAIRGAQVGDVLRVKVLDIQIADSGWTMARKGHGAIGHRIETGESRIVPIEDGEALFLDRVRLPVRPMIGSIGTTPAEGKLRAGWPGPHGGNMDCKQLVAGTTIFLPVLIPEAHLALGDLHAIQGDGESGCCALEIAGVVTLRVHLLRGLEMPLPLLVTPDHLAVIHTAPDLDQAANGAVERMADFIVRQSSISLPDAAMLLALAGNVAICQHVNPIMTCRMEVSKSVLSQLGIDLPALWQGCQVDSGQ